MEVLFSQNELFSIFWIKKYRISNIFQLTDALIFSIYFTYSLKILQDILIVYPVQWPKQNSFFELEEMNFMLVLYSYSTSMKGVYKNISDMRLFTIKKQLIFWKSRWTIYLNFLGFALHFFNTNAFLKIDSNAHFQTRHNIWCLQVQKSDQIYCYSITNRNKFFKTLLYSLVQPCIKFGKL